MDAVSKDRQVAGVTEVDAENKQMISCDNPCWDIAKRIK